MPMTNMKNNIALSVTNHSDTENPLPSEDDYARWLQHALQSEYSTVIIDVLLCDKSEIATLNINYRSKAKATNVLSFPQSDSPQLLHGDIALCAPIIEEEAHTLGVASMQHWAHLFIHGILHLQGYDHIIEQEAIIMERLEANILTELGYTLKH